MAHLSSLRPSQGEALDAFGWREATWARRAESRERAPCVAASALPGLDVVTCGRLWYVALAPMEDVIVWEAPARCPGPAVVRGEVARLLRESDHHPPYRAAARVEETSSGFTLRLVLTVGDAGGERTLSEASCAALAEAAATIIALAVDPDGVARLPAPPRSSVAPLVLSVPTSTGVAGPAFEPPVTTPSAPPPAMSYRGTVGALVGGELGTLPAVVAWIGASGSLRRGPTAFVLWGAAGTSQTVTTPTGAGADVSAAVIGASACRGLFGLSVGPCLGLSAVRIAGGGFGAGIAPRAASKVIARVEAGGEAVFERGFLGLRAALFVTLPTQRPSFVIGDDEVLFRPAAVGGRGELSGFVRF